MTSRPSEAAAWLDRVLGAAAAGLLFFLMALTTADVIGRYIFNWPLRGAFEITELLLLTLIFAGLPRGRARHPRFHRHDARGPRPPRVAPPDRPDLRRHHPGARVAGVGQGRQ